MTVRQQDIEKSSGWIDIGMLSAAALIKGIGGWIGGSPALMADALNSVSDAVRSARRSGRESSLLVCMLLTVLVLVGAVEALLSGLGRLWDKIEQTADIHAFIAFFAAVVIAEGWFLFRYRKLSRTNAELARNYAGEHRFSLYGSMLVAAGMALSIAGSGFDIPELNHADSAAAILVAAVAVIKSLRLMRMFIREAPGMPNESEEDPTPFVETVQRVHGVIEVRMLRAVRSVEMVKIDLTLSVNPRMTVKEADEIAQRSRDLLMHRFVQVIEVQVRVEPYHTGYPYKSNDELLGSADHPTIVQ
ncbi:cation diffusion facilitator family transporter [Saccharibacillus qingshengii]|uniref:cation diffusion facilitator family transporter n=1 Tax=Saccharibacillus qingshengii TaxID=1763540 RepID=UPI001551BB7C|nr:cation transporter [Saccharibacillus qingshengii]